MITGYLMKHSYCSQFLYESEYICSIFGEFLLFTWKSNRISDIEIPYSSWPINYTGFNVYCTLVLSLNILIFIQVVNTIALNIAEKQAETEQNA